MRQKVLVTGGSGLVGMGIQAIAHEFPQYQFIFHSSKMCDLCDFHQTLQMLETHMPNVILHLAAYVGGLFLNMEHKVNMFEENIMMNLNLLRAAHICSISRVISCLSTCIFPDQTTYPIDESMVHNGPPHPSNDAYAYAKRMIDVQSRAYREQYGRDYTCVTPTNIYGPFDNFHLHDGHVIPALIHKCLLAKNASTPFKVSGSGTPLRQFIHSHDVARLMVLMIEKPHIPNMILSVDPEDEISIGEVANTIALAFEYSDHMVFQPDLPDGQYRKTANNGLLRTLFPDYSFIEFSKGIQSTVQWFLENYPNVRL